MYFIILMTFTDIFKAIIQNGSLPVVCTRCWIAGCARQLSSVRPPKSAFTLVTLTGSPLLYCHLQSELIPAHLAGLSPGPGTSTWGSFRLRDQKIPETCSHRGGSSMGANVPLRLPPISLAGVPGHQASGSPAGATQGLRATGRSVPSLLRCRVLILSGTLCLPHKEQAVPP